MWGKYFYLPFAGSVRTGKQDCLPHAFGRNSGRCQRFDTLGNPAQEPQSCRSLIETLLHTSAGQFGPLSLPSLARSAWLLLELAPMRLRRVTPNFLTASTPTTTER